jgi:hypothetical protein
VSPGPDDDPEQSAEEEEAEAEQREGDEQRPAGDPAATPGLEQRRPADRKPTDGEPAEEESELPSIEGIVGDEPGEDLADEPALSGTRATALRRPG